MEKITKKEFKEIYKNLFLLQGIVFCAKEKLIDLFCAMSEEDILKNCKPVSSYGNIVDDKEGIQTTNIYQEGKFIFVEFTLIINKDRSTSRNQIEKCTTIYYKG